MDTPALEGEIDRIRSLGLEELRREWRRGIVGAFIGSWLLPQLGIHLGLGIVAAVINATIGALILLLIIRLVRGGGGWRASWGSVADRL
jgi:Transglycosylase associated protein